MFHPETIGAIAYLHVRGTLLMHRMVAGYVVTCVGDPGAFTLKKSVRKFSNATDPPLTSEYETQVGRQAPAS